MKVLVTGGAGYIGSVISRMLIDKGHTVTVLDNLESGYRDAVPSEADLVEVDLRDLNALKGGLSGRDHDAVIHMASSIVVSASEADPLGYYENNVSATINLLKALDASEVGAGPNILVLSSTAAVYAEDTGATKADRTADIGALATPDLLIHEDLPLAPNSCYGMTKQVCEDIFTRYSKLKGQRLAIFRYFNAAGAWQGLGERHDPETHLIPRLLQAAEANEPAEIYGTDHPTPDGTAIRDYVHVRDIAAAHVDVLTYGGGEQIFNLGTERGHSVLEVVTAVEQVLGKKLDKVIKEHRAGDVPRLVASSERARAELGWKCTDSELSQIIGSAYEFMSCG